MLLARYQVNLNLNPFYLPGKKPIMAYRENINEILIKGRKYLDRCLKYSNKFRFNSKTNPKISVILPMYNCEKTIKSTLNSIQNQNLSNIEIILINDFSKDSTYKIVKKKERKDHRIKIINNNRNMGTLYSRCIGVLIAKGKYIFGLDNDDLYFDYDVFDYIYKKGKKEKLDIVGFLTIDSYKYDINISKMRDIYSYIYPDDFYVEQPELATWIIKFNNRFIIHNNMIWDKCFKSSLYKKSVNFLGKSRYSIFLSWAEDTSMNFIIFTIAKNFKYIHKYGVFHLRNNSTASLRLSTDFKIFGEIFFLDIIFDFSMNNSDVKNFLIEQAQIIKNKYNINKFNDINSIYLKNVLQKIINCQYVNKINKRKIKKHFNIYFTH